MGNEAAGAAATLTRLWAVATLTFKEAIRRKIFLIVIFFAVALVGSAAFLPAMGAESRLRLIQVWSVRASFVFSLILAVFFAGFSITGDVETRRIYTLVSKPIHKVTLFFGKFLGFVLMIAAFLGSTGVITVIYLRVVAATTTGFPPLRVESRFDPTPDEAVPSFELKSGARTEGRYTEEGGEYVVTGRSGAVRRIRKEEVADITMRPPSSVSVTHGYVNPDIGAAKIVGGDTPAGVITWEYRGLDRSAFEPDVKARVKVDLGRVGQPYEIEGRVRITVRNPSTRAAFEVPFEKLQTNHVTEFSFTRDLVDETGRVTIELTTDDPGLVVIAKSDRVIESATAPRAMQLFGRSELFELTYFKGLVLVLFQSMVVLAVTLSMSAFLTAPVSILFGVMVFLLGWFWGFMSESVRDVDDELKAFRARQAEHEKAGDHAGHDHDDHGPAQVAPPWMMKVSSAVSKVVLAMVPNFDLFNMSDYLLKDLAVMRRDLLQGFLAMVPRVAVLLLIGVVAMRFRDFSA
jgi:hypothetical protein